MAAPAAGHHRARCTLVSAADGSTPTTHEEPRLVVSTSPQISVLSMIGAVCGRNGDVPRRVREHVLARVSPLDLLDTWRPMRSMADSFAPDVVAPDWPGDVTVAEYAEWLRLHGEDELVSQIGRAGAGRVGAWRRELSEPRRWVNAYRSASLATWKAMTPIWDSNARLIESETLRVALAQVRGAGRELLNSIHPAIAFSHNHLVIATGADESLEIPVGARTINLVPMIAASGSWYVSCDNPDTITFAYGLPRSAIWDESPSGSESAIALLLGLPRAKTLYYLRRQRRVGELARHLRVAPSTATHHCDLLESAGLVSRVRHGKFVMVVVTDRGRELIDVLR